MGNGAVSLKLPNINFDINKLNLSNQVVWVGGKIAATIAATIGVIFLAIGLIAAVGFFAAPGIVPALNVITEGALSIMTGGAASFMRIIIDGGLFHGKGYILLLYTIPKYIADGIYNTSIITSVGIPLAIAAGSVIAIGGVLVVTGSATAIWAEKKLEKEKEKVKGQHDNTEV